MDSITRNKQYAQWLVVLAAMILPFLLIRFFPGFYHASDVDDFRRWSQAWEADWRSVYVNCERCNYPFVGTLLSGGVMSAINIETFARLANRFRYYLAVVDALNILALWLILKNLQVKNAPLWAGVIGLLPSSWLGSSVWGQIDGIGQFLILLFFLLLIWFNRQNRSVGQAYLFAALAGFLLSLMLLTKQLIYFSVFALGMIFIANILTRFGVSIRGVLAGAIALLAFSLPVFLVDLSLKLKDPYFSHLQYILATGSQHGSVVTYTGFNLWVFFSNDPLGSSRLPVPVQIGSQTLFSVVPYSAGIFLFLTVNALLVLVFAKGIHRSVLPEEALQRQFILISLVYLALVNLGFNLTLTGTHERYLYHFYPFILAACLALLNRPGFFNRSMLAVLLAGACLYGVYLFAYLNRWVLPSSLAALRWMSAIHLMLFGYILFAAIRQFGLRMFDLSQS
ncbi:MAG: hypothetical protein DPW18_07680 [Chloroflexi bacterium]|nr:hypothetical protein [Chloroflexota bacterium]MDL1941543.1 hypothetical protein [Chloroflexi bacterium CFX2]